MPISSDLKQGFRQIIANPGSALLAIMAYSLGLGLVGLILALYFGVVKGQPKDINLDEIYFLQWDADTQQLWKEGFQTAQFRIHDYYEIKERQDVFKTLAVTRPSTFSVVVGKHAERFNGEYVTSEYFEVMQSNPHRGNYFQSGDDRPDSGRKAVISFRIWEDYFKSSDTIVGRSITINGSPTTVIGVAPKGFDFPAKMDLWVNETANPVGTPRGSGEVYVAIGQLRDDVTPAKALSSLNTVAKQLEAEYPQSNTGFVSVDLRPVSSVYIGQETRDMVYFMLGSATLVLLIACANVANLTLARATTRVKELAIRSSLGGQRKRLVIQMLVEGFAIALIGGIGGLIVSIWGGKIIWAWVSTKVDSVNIPSWMNLDPDLRLIATLFLFTLLASLIASIIPALQASRTDVNDILKDNARGATGLRLGRFSKLLVLLQITVSCGILIATFSLVSAAREGSKFEPPYETKGMITAFFSISAERYPDSNRAVFIENLQKSFAERKGIAAVGFTSAIDMMFNWASRFEIQGKPSETPDQLINGRNEVVSDNYFETLGIPLLYGRSFQTLDAAKDSQSVCIINIQLAETLSPGNPQGALGMQLRDVWDPSNPWLNVIGIVPDTSMAGPGKRTSDQLAGLFRPISQSPLTELTVFARVDGDPLLHARQLQNALREMDDSIALYRIKTLEDAIEDANFAVYFYRNMFGLFGIAALLLASIGVYGVMSFSVRQRFQEFSIRQALGADAGTIFRQVIRMGSWQITIGLLLGSALGWALLQVIDSQFGGGLTSSVVTYLLPILLLAGISLISLYSPSKYVTSANLSETLRNV